MNGFSKRKRTNDLNSCNLQYHTGATYNIDVSYVEQLSVSGSGGGTRKKSRKAAKSGHILDNNFPHQSNHT